MDEPECPMPQASVMENAVYLSFETNEQADRFFTWWCDCGGEYQWLSDWGEFIEHWRGMDG